MQPEEGISSGRAKVWVIDLLIFLLVIDFFFEVIDFLLSISIDDDVTNLKFKFKIQNSNSLDIVTITTPESVSV